MLAVPQQKFVPEIEVNENNFRGTEKDEDFYFLSQHLNSPGLLIDEQEEEYPADYFNNPPPTTHFEIANRAFYATINKFTRQSCPDASRRRSPPYSFLENWHLHSIYSKSQQTLLGITPVRPSVLLSGDDFMFTPPFIQRDEEEQEQECIMDQDWNHMDEPKPEFYTLSPCPDSNGTLSGLLYEEDVSSTTTTATHDKQFSDYCNRNTQENIWMENDRYHLPIHIQQNDDLLLLQHDQVLLRHHQQQLQHQHQQQQEEEEEEEEELYTTDSSSSDEQRCSEDDDTSFNLTHLYDLEEDSTSKQDVVQPISAMTRSSSFLSQKSSSSSVMSYQSLADIMNNNSLEQVQVEERNNNNYGSTTINNNPQLPIADLTNQANNYARNYNDDVEMGARHNIRTTYHAGPFTCLIYIWQFLVLWLIPCARNIQEEREPLL